MEYHDIKVGQIVTCINNDFKGRRFDSLTVGKPYEITGANDTWARLLDDDGCNRSYCLEKGIGEFYDLETYFTWAGK